MIVRLKRFSVYTKTDKDFDEKVILSTGQKLLNSGRVVNTYSWKISGNPKIRIEVSVSSSFTKSYNKPTSDKDRIKKLRKEIEDGYIFDNPPGNPLKSRTHCMGDSSTPNSVLKINRKIYYTKTINLNDRLYYKIGYPYPDGDEYVFPVVLEECEGHKHHSGKLFSSIMSKIKWWLED